LLLQTGSEKVKMRWS